LTVRDWDGRNPTRIVLDRNAELDTNLNLFNGEVETLVYSTVEGGRGGENGIGFERVCLNKEDFVRNMLNDLYKRHIASVIIEGGSQVLNSFIELEIWDEARVFTSNQRFEEGVKAPQINGNVEQKEEIGSDMLVVYTNPKTKGHWLKN
jgi:diaminohydroxyphosphoribosylaminopyrimidine deaminase/5-amino-6-(5-phosphoribosylamino)uracil reductase